MALYAIADLHLSLGTDKPMDDFRGWAGYVEKLEANWRATVRPEDTVVIPGDVSWGMTLEEAEKDFAFLDSLPGRKLLMKGNHDYWWTTRRKMETFFADHAWSTLNIQFNDAYETDVGITVCGTRGWFYDAENGADMKVLNREVGRLNASLDAAKKLDGEPVVFLHYPPVFGNASCEEILEVLRSHGIRRCFYGHIHGAGIAKAFQGNFDGTSYRLVSADALGFMPMRIDQTDCP